MLRSTRAFFCFACSTTSLQGDACFADVMRWLGCRVSSRRGCPWQQSGQGRSTPRGGRECFCAPDCVYRSKPEMAVGACSLGAVVGNGPRSAADGTDFCHCCSAVWLSVEGPREGLREFPLHALEPSPGHPGNGLSVRVDEKDGGQALLSPEKAGSSGLAESASLPWKAHVDCGFEVRRCGDAVTVDVSQMQDCFMTLAVLGAIAVQRQTAADSGEEKKHRRGKADQRGTAENAVGEGRVNSFIRLIGGRTMRVKESDRISAMARGLTTAGLTVKEFDDGLGIYGATSATMPLRIRRLPSEASGATIAAAQGDALDAAPLRILHSMGDHRIAMSFTVLALLRNDLAIEDVRNFCRELGQHGLRRAPLVQGLVRGSNGVYSVAGLSELHVFGRLTSSLTSKSKTFTFFLLLLAAFFFSGSVWIRPSLTSGIYANAAWASKYMHPLLPPVLQASSVMPLLS